jgi:hypothetical protein
MACFLVVSTSDYFLLPVASIPPKSQECLSILPDFFTGPFQAELQGSNQIRSWVARSHRVQSSVEHEACSGAIAIVQTVTYTETLEVASFTYKRG